MSLQRRGTVTPNCAHQMETAPASDSLIHWSGVTVTKLPLFSPKSRGFGHRYRPGRGKSEGIATGPAHSEVFKNLIVSRAVLTPISCSFPVEEAPGLPRSLINVKPS